MLPSTIRTCRSELFTVFTVPLRCTVNRTALLPQRFQGCLYGFYGVKAHTHYIYDNKNFNNSSVLARVRYVYDTVKSVKSVNDMPQTLMNQRLQSFTVFKTHRKKSGDTVNNFRKEVRK